MRDTPRASAPITTDRPTLHISMCVRADARALACVLACVLACLRACACMCACARARACERAAHRARTTAASSKMRWKMLTTRSSSVVPPAATAGAAAAEAAAAGAPAAAAAAGTAAGVRSVRLASFGASLASTPPGVFTACGAAGVYHQLRCAPCRGWRNPRRVANSSGNPGMAKKCRVQRRT
jgi:hypothetical protein